MLSGGDGAPLVNTTSATMAELVDSKKIRDLPLNARDYVQLATLQPGVAIVQTGSFGVSGIARGVGVKLTISGARTNSNSFLLDGTDVNDYANTTPGAITGSNLGVEAIREFQVLTNTYSAEYGRSAGGIISAVSRSGTNELHGSVFAFHRNDNLDAHNFFDNATGREKPEFRRHQYGAAVGGPIVKDKVFFFSNYEGHRELTGRTTISQVLTARAREGNLSSRLGGPVTVHPAIKPILSIHPLPNGALDSSGDLGDFITDTSTDIREDYVVGKIDHQLSDAHSYFVRYTFDDALIQSNDAFTVNRENSGSRRQFTTIDWKTIISPTLLNSATLAFNRTVTFSGRLTPLTQIPNISFIPGRPLGSTSVTGMSGFPGGPGTSDQDIFAYNVIQGRDDVNWTRGRHAFKFGVNVERIHTNMNSTQGENGAFSFTSIPNFLTNRPNTFRGQALGSDTIRGFRQSLIGLYIQDDVKVNNRLTLNAGLRWEFVTDITEVQGKISQLVNYLDPAFTPGKFFENPSFENFAPRIGLAWDPTGSGNTAIRAGFAIFYDQIITHYFSGGQGVRVPPFFRRVTLSGSQLTQGDFPSGAYQKIDRGEPFLEVDVFEYDPGQPYSMQFNLNVQRQLPGDMVVMAAYVGYRGVHLKRIAEDGNLRIPVVLSDGRLFFNHAGKTPCPIQQCVNTPRRNPNFTVIKSAALDGQSHYHGLQLGMNKRFSRGLQFQTSYTFSKALDDSSGVFNEKDLGNSNNYPYFWDSKYNRGPADFDIRHNLMLNYTYDLPVPKMSGIGGVLLNGWQWGGILRSSTGHPYTPVLGSDQGRTLSGRGAGGQRPSVAPGASGKIESTGDPNQWFDLSQFIFPEAGFFGNLGRGTGTGDGVTTFDMSLSKKTYLNETRYLQFRAEFFNALNHANFDDPGRPAVFDSAGRLNSRAARITSTTTTNRQIQLSLKFIF